MSNEVRSELSKLEKGGVTCELTAKLHLWNHSKKHPTLGALGARVVGFISTPVTSAVDTVAHGLFFVGKTVTGVFVSPYNFMARKIQTKYEAPKDLEISSALVHLSRAVGSLFNVALLPFVMLMNPSRGYALTNSPKEESSEKIKEKEKKIAELEKKATTLEKDLAEKDKAISRLTPLTSQNATVIAKKQQLEQQLSNVNAELAQLKTQVEKTKQEHANELAQKQQELTDLQTKLAEAEKKAAELDAVRADLGTNKTERDQLLQTIREKEAEIDFLKSQVSAKEKESLQVAAGKGKSGRPPSLLEEIKLAAQKREKRQEEGSSATATKDARVEEESKKQGVSSDVETSELDGLVSSWKDEDDWGDSEPELTSEKVDATNAELQEIIKRALVQNIVPPGYDSVKDKPTQVEEHPEWASAAAPSKPPRRDKKKPEGTHSNVEESVPEGALKPDHKTFIENIQGNPIAISRLHNVISCFLETLESTSGDEEEIELGASLLDDDHPLLKSTLDRFRGTPDRRERKAGLARKAKYFEWVLEYLGELRRENAARKNGTKAGMVEKERDIEQKKTEQQAQKIKEQRTKLLEELEFDFSSVDGVVKRSKWNLFLKQESWEDNLVRDEIQELKNWCEKGNLEDANMKQRHEKLVILLNKWISP
ncbi:MAG: hypothetical protein ACE5GN_06365 [Waddliaceae bacterium]